MLGAQRDAAATSSWAKASLEEKHRKLLGAKADWNPAVGIEHNPVALGKYERGRGRLEEEEEARDAGDDEDGVDP